jgi:[protein-PII] uridylyltransferase
MKKQHPTETEVLKRIKSREILYAAVLLHDIAKGRGGDHSEVGGSIAEKLCPRLGFSPEATDTVAWLVRHHLAMSMTAQKRDLNDLKTIEDFAKVVETPERLRLLFVLTVCDMRATGPNVWTTWKAALLRELYLATEERLSGSAVSGGRQGRIADAKARVRELLSDWDDDSFAAFAQRNYAVYWLSFDADTIARHARLLRDADRAKRSLVVDQRVDLARGVTEVTVYTADHPGLFSRIAGAMAVAGANIVDARIFTTVDGMALDSFSVQDLNEEAIARPDKLARLAATIERTMQGEVKPHRMLAKPPPIPSRTRIFTVTPSVHIDNNASTTHSVIEIVARDRPGLLNDVTTCLTSLGLQISTAKISTFGERAVDTFYVKDVFGLQVTNASKLGQIRERLMTALADPNRPAADVAATPIRVRAAQASAVRRARRSNDTPGA